jgi:hypothetical protein
MRRLIEHRRSLGFIAILIALLGGPSLHCEEPPISFKLNARVCAAPCTIVMTLRVEKHEANYQVVLEAHSDLGYSRTSYIDYQNGGPVTTQIKYPDLPGGEYEFRASLFRHSAGTWLAGSAKQSALVSGF